MSRISGRKAPNDKSDDHANRANKYGPGKRPGAPIAIYGFRLALYLKTN